jgi:hypothetical protein
MAMAIRLLLACRLVSVLSGVRAADHLPADDLREGNGGYARG